MAYILPINFVKIHISSKPKAHEMKQENNIAVVSSDGELRQNLFSVLEHEKYKASQAESIKELEKLLASGKFIAAVVDIDFLPISNRMIRELSTQYPGIYLLCISSSRTHPDLQDAFSNHIYACIQKPLDMNELLYFVRCIYIDSTGQLE
jgi:DNA-binding NtrC family response regulator